MSAKSSITDLLQRRVWGGKRTFAWDVQIDSRPLLIFHAHRDATALHLPNPVTGQISRGLPQMIVKAAPAVVGVLDRQHQLAPYQPAERLHRI